MSWNIEPVSKTRVTIEHEGRGTVTFDVDLSDAAVNEMMYLFGNPEANKVWRTKWARQILGCGLREALLFVEESQARYRDGYYIARQRALRDELDRADDEVF